MLLCNVSVYEMSIFFLIEFIGHFPLFCPFVLISGFFFFLHGFFCENFGEIQQK
jgi:hypothetical protein